MKENFKLKEIKTYGSLEILYAGARKYRQLFDAAETCYINTEATLYNLKFEEQDQLIHAFLRCIDLANNNVICNLEKKETIKATEPIFIIRDGWGRPEPGFWKKGNYKWQLWINNQLISEMPFFILDKGEVTSQKNPYFNIHSIKLYNSDKTGLPLNQRQYLDAFDSKTAQYINIELCLQNLCQKEPLFPLEVLFNIYNQDHHLKAHMRQLVKIEDEREIIYMDAGYGKSDATYWQKGKYIAEIVFMDKLIASLPFEIGNANVEYTGDVRHYIPRWEQAATAASASTTQTLTFDEAKAELEALIGLQSVKKQLNEFATYLQFLKLRAEKGFEEKAAHNLHSVFMGNPGTGKTTVAHMLGKIYKSLGLLKTDKVHEVGRADLVAEYIGQTAPRVRRAIEEARDGILFIDEAYSLTDRGDDNKDFGREVIEVLLKEMSDGEGNIAIICAGYTKEMQNFLQTNPGLSSRFGQVVHFPDYNPEELMQIAHYVENKKGVQISPDAAELIHNNIVEAYRNRNKNFGNARYISTIIENAKHQLALRVMQTEYPTQLTNEQLSVISYADAYKVFEKEKKQVVQLPPDPKLLAEALQELNSLTGMQNIKKEINEMVKLVQYYQRINRNYVQNFSLHTVFTGNPGTGKTTVARILVKIYKALGILERGHLVECDRKDLVAGFIGQTAIKTNALIESAMGGGLFIDEAYALSTGHTADYGKEAIETVLKQMEDRRNEFVVIAAGYTKEMQQFLEYNPGLKSRFDKTYHFEDYTAPELLQIAESHYAKNEMEMTKEATAFLSEYISNLLKNKDKNFSNARAIRKIVEESTRQQHLRLAELDPTSRNDENLKLLTVEDLQYLKTQNNEALKETRKLGFGSK